MVVPYIHIYIYTRWRRHLVPKFVTRTERAIERAIERASDRAKQSDIVRDSPKQSEIVTNNPRQSEILRGSLLRASLLRGSLPRGSLFPILSDICEKHTFYRYGHNSGQKWVPRHDSDGIRREISREKRWDTSQGLQTVKKWRKNNVQDMRIKR